MTRDLLLQRRHTGGWAIKPELAARCTQIADTVVPKFRDGKKSYSCTGSVAKRWQTAWDAACIALGYDPKDKHRHREREALPVAHRNPDDALEVSPSALQESSTAPSEMTTALAWQRTLSRVTLHPAFPLKIQLDVKPKSPDEMDLTCTILTTDARIPPEICKEPPYDQPTTGVRHRVSVPTSTSSYELVSRVVNLVRHGLLHEVDECILIDGSPAKDPHSND
jgi:hypothetical protein